MISVQDRIYWYCFLTRRCHTEKILRNMTRRELHNLRHVCILAINTFKVMKKLIKKLFLIVRMRIVADAVHCQELCSLFHELIS